MSEAEQAKAEARRAHPDRTRQPFDLSEALRAKVVGLGLSRCVAQLQEEGYGFIRQPASLEFNRRLREACLRVSAVDAGQSGGANMALAKDPVFVDVALNPKLLTIVEIMVGKGALLSQMAISVRGKGAPALALHADQNWTPAPFPVHNQLVTFCWACDEFSQAGGSTKVIPRTHLERRHPTAAEIKEQRGAIPTACEPNTVVVWDGSIWHGNYPRTIDGQRVVLHVTYSRLALRPVECYDSLGEDWLKDKPYAMRVLLGREDFLNSPTGADYSKLAQTFAWAKT